MDNIPGRPTVRRPSSGHARPALRDLSRGPIWGGLLGAVLLGWCILMAVAPELGSLIAVFGSPVLAFFVIVRLLTPQRGTHGSTREWPSRN
jgi:hypothetical protein